MTTENTYVNDIDDIELDIVLVQGAPVPKFL